MYVVVLDDNNNFTVKDIRNKYKIPEDRIVGDLTQLYSKLVEPTKPIQSDEKNFFNDLM